MILGIMYRYYQTSAKTAIDWGDPTQIAPGYLLHTGDPPGPPEKPNSFEQLDIRTRELEKMVAGEPSECMY
jgi:hypothetical protein